MSWARRSPPIGLSRGRPAGAPARLAISISMFWRLSWSPGFCRTPAAARAGGQCDPGAGLGFVVHGLWPQYEHGYPQDCAFGARSPSRIALQGAAGRLSERGPRPLRMAQARRLRRQKPDRLFRRRAPRARRGRRSRRRFRTRRRIKAGRRSTFSAPSSRPTRRLRPGMIGVACAKGALQEVRICLSKDLRDFRACPEVGRAAIVRAAPSPCRRRCDG